jgi:hypothetical protein
MSAPHEFDLFVVHAESDRAWVDGYLKPMLGLEPARVFTPRDFRLGAVVAAEFERGVTSSRFTLLVLSPAFLADRWAEFGEGLVSFSSVDEGRNRLLSLTLHPCQAPLRLRFRASLDCTDWTRWDDESARLRQHLDAPEPTVESVPCPYPGMVPFRKEDARFFHGRDAEIQNLLTLVRQHHFLAVIGSSGSGKSSLITAGLLPRLDDARNFPRGTWRVLSLRPGTTPVEELARILGSPPDDCAAVVARSLAADPSAQRLLLIVDQFEELFSQVKEAPKRDAFIGHLKALRADPRCTVILTMRADFYGDLMNSPFWPIDRSQLVEVAALRGESLRQAIVKPAEAVGVYLEDGLVERLLADAADEPGSLPMLQEALVLLWGTMSGRLLTRASYDALGHDGRSGLAVAMATKADATLAALPPDRQRVARRIFLRLVQFGEGRPDTRRQLGVDDLRAESDDPGAFDDLLQHLIANRLLTPSTDEVRGLRVDIAHEMLIIGWPAFRDWVESRRDAEKTRRRLLAKAEEWVRLGRAESGLLDPVQLAEADAWLSGPDAAELGVDSDVQALAVASRRAIDSLKRRKRMRTQVAIGGLTTALIAISALGVWGELKRLDAVRARETTEITAAEGLFRPLVHEGANLNEREVEALMQLGELQADQEGVRLKFLETALSDTSRATRLANRVPVAIQAAIGLDPKRRDHALRILRSKLDVSQKSFSIRVAVALVATELETSDRDANESALATLLEAFANANPTPDRRRLVDPIANQLVKAMETQILNEQERVASEVIGALERATDPVVRRALAEGLAGAAKGLPPDRAARVLAGALERATDPVARRALAEGLAGAAKRLRPDGAEKLLAEKLLAPVAQALTDTLKKAIYPRGSRALAESLAAAANGLPLDRAAQALADALEKASAQAFADALMKASTGKPRPDLAAALRVVAGDLSLSQAEKLLVPVAQALAEELEWPGALGRRTVAEGLAAATEKLPRGRAEALLDPIAQDLAHKFTNERDPLDRQDLAECLGAVAGGLSPDQALKLLRPVAQALADDTRNNNKAYEYINITTGLAAAAKGLRPLEAAQFLADALRKWKGGSYSRCVLAEGLVEVAKGLPPDQAAQTLATAYAQARMTDTGRVLSEGLASIAEGLPLDQIIRARVAALRKQTDPFVLRSLAKGLAAAKGLPPTMAEELLAPAARELTLAIKNVSSPVSPGLRSILAEGLAAIAKAVPDRAEEWLTTAAQILAHDFASGHARSFDTELAKGLAAVASGLPPKKAEELLAPVVQELTRTLKEQQSSPIGRAEGLAAVAKGLSPSVADGLLAPSAQVLADALARETDADARLALAEGLAAVAVWLPPDRGAQMLMDCSGQFLDLSMKLSPAIGELTSRVSIERAVEWLKYPLCYGQAAAAILNQIKTPEGKTFRTRWELVEWLQKNRPEIDLTLPPIDPDRSSQR